MSLLFRIQEGIIMQRHAWKLAALAPLALLLWTGPAAASTQVGQVVVEVTGKTGEALAGATVEILAESGIGGTKSGDTDEAGRVRFTQLPPGEYTVTVRKADFQTKKAVDVKVDIGGTSRVSVSLVSKEEAKDVEEIVVSGQVPVVDTEKMALGGTVNDTFTETVPTDRTYQGLAQLLPGVSGGSNPNVLGGTLYGNQYLLDGINVTDPVTNTFSANFNFDAIQTLEVLTGGRDAEYGSAVGGVLNVVTKSGSNDFHADVSVYYQPDALQLKEKDEEGLRNEILEVNLAAGGPIIKDKLWYFASAQVPYTAFSTPEPDNGWNFSEPHPSRTFLGFFGLGKLTYQMSPNQTFKLLIQGDPAVISNNLQDPTVDPKAEMEQVQTGIIVAAYSETFLTQDLFWNTRLAYSQNKLDIHPESGDEETPGRFNSDTGFSTVNYTRMLEDNRTRVQLHSALSYMVDDLIGEHQLKGGVDVSLSWNTVTDTRPGGMRYVDAGVSDPTNPLSQPLPDYRWVVADPEDTKIFGDAEGFFVQDVWKPIPNVIVRPGLRFDTARMRNWDGETQVHLNTLSPRVGVAWDPFDDGKTLLRAGYWQYIDTGYLALSGFAGGRTKLEQRWYYNSVTDQYDSFGGQQGGADGAIGKDYLKEAWNQQRPRTHEVIVGFNREIIPDLEFAGNFIYRRHNNQWEDDEVNLMWNADGTDVIGYRDGQDRWIFALGALREAFIRYIGFELVLTKRFSRNWEMLASYSYSRTEGTEPDAISIAFDNPAQRDYEFGWLPHDRRHSFKLFASYQFPLGIVFGGSVRYLSGLPYNRWRMNDFYGDYYNRYAPRGEDWDPDTLEPTGKALRLPDQLRANLRLQWQLEELTSQKVDLILDVFNVFNARTTIEVEENELGDGSFGQTTDRLDPLALQIGLRYRY
jgi:outer membrane receptor protein involved in Fe transport